MDLARGYRKKADLTRLIARQVPDPRLKDIYLAKAEDYERRAMWIELERIKRSDAPESHTGTSRAVPGLWTAQLISR